MKKHIRLAFIGVAIGVLILIGSYFIRKTSASTANNPPTTQIPSVMLTIAELTKYDGTDPTKPIYIAFEGLVYDVTTGKSFYAPGGTYHWLAGKDSTKDLALIGGDIIKRKYPVVGKLIQ